MRAGNDDGGVAKRRMLAVERDALSGGRGEWSGWEPMPVREDMDIVSACVREVVVRTDEELDFLDRPRLKILDDMDAEENMLEVSL